MSGDEDATPPNGALLHLANPRDGAETVGRTMLRRMFGFAQSQPPLTRWLVLPDGHVIDVVGAQYHQTELRMVEKALAAAGPNKQTLAHVFREPTNRYDRNAVAVALVTPGRSDPIIVGYLKSELARALGRELKRIEALGYAGAASIATLGQGWGRGRIDQQPIAASLAIASKRQVRKYVTALATNPHLEPAGFADDTESKAYGEQVDWDVPGWIEEIDG